MRTQERSLSLPGWHTVQGGMSRVRHAFVTAPLPVKIIIVALLCVFSIPLATLLLLAGLVYAPFAVWAGRRTVVASLSVALWGIAVTAALAHGPDGPRYALLVLPLLVTAAAHAGALGRWFVPCRTVAWTLGWALPIGIVMFRLLQHG